MVHVRATAPTRIDLAGGTLDLWPIHQLLDRKATVNVGITLPAEVDITDAKDGVFRFESRDQGKSVSGDFKTVCATRDLPLVGLLLRALWNDKLPPLKIVTGAKSPAGAGLGGSSCLGVTIAGALWKARQSVEPGLASMTEEALVQTVSDVEAKLIHAPTGIQDYWGGIRGRVNVITFPPGRVMVETLPAARVAGLADELIPCFSGKSRQSAINNWEIFKRIFDGDKALLAIFNDIGRLGEECGNAVRDGDLARVVAISEEEWKLRLRLWPAIETEETKRLDRAARSAGARFSRVCGAGGGGVMGIFAPKAARAKVCAALTAAGGQVLDATVADRGLTVESL